MDPKIKFSEVEKFYKSQEINQLNKKPHVTRESLYKIVAPDLSFNMDHIFINRALKGSSESTSDNYYLFLLCVDIGSRKAYIYPQQNKNQNETIKAFDQFIVELNKDIHKFDGTPDEYDRETPIKIYADSAFDFHQMNERCKKLDIILDTQTAKDDHYSKGNRLGIIDRLTRTIKNILMRYVYTHRRYSIPEVVSIIVDNYNDSPHQSLSGLTPNQVFGDKHTRFLNFMEGIEHNKNIIDKIDLEPGDHVRILESKSEFGKEKPGFSKQIFIITSQRGYKYQIEDQDGTKHRRLFKHHELQKVPKNTTAPNGGCQNPETESKPGNLNNLSSSLEKKIHDIFVK